MIVISDSSPIMNLSAIGQLDLIKHLYQKLVIPQEVYNEIAILGVGLPGSIEVQTCDWIESKQVTNHVFAGVLQGELDKGEAEVIALAVELKADFILLDERLARAVASRLGLKFIGLLGVLIEAKHRGLIQAIKPILDNLIVKAGFWINQQLYTRVLQAAGE